MREVVCKKAAAFGHTAKCPDCGSLTLVTGPPQKVKCVCGAEWFATWFRHGDPVIKIQST